MAGGLAGSEAATRQREAMEAAATAWMESRSGRRRGQRRGRWQRPRVRLWARRKAAMAVAAMARMARSQLAVRPRARPQAVRL